VTITFPKLKYKITYDGLNDSFRSGDSEENLSFLQFDLLVFVIKYLRECCTVKKSCVTQRNLESVFHLFASDVPENLLRNKRPDHGLFFLIVGLVFEEFLNFLIFSQVHEQVNVVHRAFNGLFEQLEVVLLELEEIIRFDAQSVKQHDDLLVD
jgi:hypothetical protein